MKKNFLNEIIEKFLHYAETSEGAFSFTVNSTNYYFLQEKVGKGRFFYVDPELKEDYCFSLERHYNLAAIASEDGTYYLVSYNRYLLGYYLSANEDYCLPENVKCYEDAVKEQTEFAVFHWLPAFLEEIPSCPPQGEEMKKAAKAAREIFFSGKTGYDYLCEKVMDRITDPISKKVWERSNPSWTSNAPWMRKKFDRALLKSLCGITDLKEAVWLHLTENKERWMKAKGFAEAVNALIENGQAVEAWETRLEDAVKNAHAKTLLAAFRCGRKTGVGRVLSANLLDALVENRCFEDDDFTETKVKCGSTVICSVGPGLGDSLTCRNIETITYKGKVIYEKG